MLHLRAALEGDRQQGHPINWVFELQLLDGSRRESVAKADHTRPSFTSSSANWTSPPEEKNLGLRRGLQWGQQPEPIFPERLQSDRSWFRIAAGFALTLSWILTVGCTLNRNEPIRFNLSFQTWGRIGARYRYAQQRDMRGGSSILKEPRERERSLLL